MATLVSADLHFELQREGLDPVTGHLTGHDNRLRLDVDDPGAFAGPGDVDAIRALASGLARRGVSVAVHSEGRHLLTIGTRRAPWWQRRLTGSRHLRLGSVRGAWTSARARTTRTTSALPSGAALPPTTPWPVFPTFGRRVRRRPTSTHDPAGGGAPRLVLTKETVWGGERQPVYWISDGLTIGSSAECDVRLPGLAPRHATVRSAPGDEYVVVLHEPGRVHGARVGGRTVLRTGSRVELGPHVLVYHREEYADHGRPHGGRLGGELGRQLPQGEPGR